MPIWHFKLKTQELKIWRSQIATSKSLKKGLGLLPYTFPGQGVTNLSSVLRSKKAIEVNVKIIRTFVVMRRFLQENNEVFDRMNYLKKSLKT